MGSIRGVHGICNRKLLIIYDYDTLKARRFRVSKSVGQLKQEEGMGVWTLGTMGVPLKQHKLYAGYNTGSVISTVRLQPLNKLWGVNFEDKKGMHGKMRLPVGGAMDDGDDEDSGDEEANEAETEIPPTVDTDPSALPSPTGRKAKTRAAQNVEPFTYNSLPAEFFDDTLDALCVKDSYDFTPGDGECAMAHLRSRRGYIGICFTDLHRQRLHDRLIEQDPDVLWHGRRPALPARLCCASQPHCHQCPSGKGRS